MRLTIELINFKAPPDTITGGILVGCTATESCVDAVFKIVENPCVSRIGEKGTGILGKFSYPKGLSPYCTTFEPTR